MLKGGCGLVELRKIGVLDVANHIIKYYQEHTTYLTVEEVYDRLEVLVYNIQLYVIYHKGPFTFQSIPYHDMQGPRYIELDGYKKSRQQLTYIESDYSNIDGYRFNPRILSWDDQQVIYQTIKYLEHVSTEQLKKQVRTDSVTSYRGVKVYYTYKDIQSSIKRYYQTNG